MMIELRQALLLYQDHHMFPHERSQASSSLVITFVDVELDELSKDERALLEGEVRTAAADVAACVARGAAKGSGGFAAAA